MNNKRTIIEEDQDDDGEIRFQTKTQNEDNRRLKEEHQERLIKGYYKKYTTVSQKMVNDYKRYAINAFLTENYSKDEFKKYSDKYKELVEKALYAD